MKKFLQNNGLSVAFFLLFLLSLLGQVFAGWNEYNKHRVEEGQAAVRWTNYVKSGHFIQATFENWESEFLQMALFVLLTISLKQKGSSESKSMDEVEEVDRQPSSRKKDAPWPVRKGGWMLSVYKHSLTIALFILFFISFVLHLKGSLADENEELMRRGLPTESLSNFITGSRFWFESFQNWQSEFLSVFTIVVLSIYLRQQGSPQSKPVDASHAETGGRH